jgi:DNA polymerase-3 subunit gamma/tau
VETAPVVEHVSESIDSPAAEPISNAALQAPSSSVAVMEPAIAVAAKLETAEQREVPVEPTAAWDQRTAERVWQETLRGLESMTETFARVVKKVHAAGDKRMCLVFPADAALAMQRCELPEHKTVLTETVSRLAGKPITLELQSAPPTAAPKKPEPAANKPSRMQRMREIEANELVKSCVEIFDAAIVRIDKPG